VVVESVECRMVFDAIASGTWVDSIVVAAKWRRSCVPDPGQPGLLSELVELVQHELVPQGLTGGAGEDQVLLVPGKPGGQPLDVLTFALALQPLVGRCVDHRERGVGVVHRIGELAVRRPSDRLRVLPRPGWSQ